MKRLRDRTGLHEEQPKKPRILAENIRKELSDETQSTVRTCACAGDNLFLHYLSSAGAQACPASAAADDRGRPLMEVLKDRKSTREFGSGTRSEQTLSNLLWAAFGINRPDGRRTAPSAMNWQEVSIY